MITAPVESISVSSASLVERMRRIALRGLPAMFSPRDALFVFRRSLRNGAIVNEGLSHRYSAITLIALARESQRDRDAALHGLDATTVLRQAASRSVTLGDVALACWAAVELQAQELQERLRRQLHELEPDRRPCPTVDLAWALTALSVDPSGDARGLRDRVAQRLITLYDERSGTFPHGAGTTGALRSHVACFADQIYPVQALAEYVARTGDPRARTVAESAASHLCARQGLAGQWWWHYDTRTGDIVERYPVYAVHQDGMAPMALRALERVSDLRFSASIANGLEWLASAPEIDGRSLINDEDDVIWRKVARHERLRAARYVQAAVTRMRPGTVWPGLDQLFPAGAVDFECRPYHLAWLLYAWPAAPGATTA